MHPQGIRREVQANTEWFVAGLASLGERTRRLIIPAGESLWSDEPAAESLYAIVDGRMWSEQGAPEFGQPATLVELGPGAVIACLDTVCGESHSAIAVAIEDTTVMEVDLSALTMLALGFPDVADRLPAVVKHEPATTRELVDSYS